MRPQSAEDSATPQTRDPRAHAKRRDLIQQRAEHRAELRRLIQEQEDDQAQSAGLRETIAELEQLDATPWSEEEETEDEEPPVPAAPAKKTGRRSRTQAAAAALLLMLGGSHA